MRAYRGPAYDPGSYIRNLGAGGVAPNTDPFYSLVKLLLHAQGVNGSTTFTDNSPLVRVPATIAGNVQISTAQAIFGTSSIYFDGAGDYIRYAADDFDSAFGRGDFAVQCRWRPDSAVLDSALVTFNIPNVTTGAQIGWGLRHMGATGTGKVQFYAYEGATTPIFLAGTTALLANTWYEITVERVGKVLNLWIDGVLEATQTGISNDINWGNTMTLTLGRYADTAILPAKGFLQEVRITKGTWRRNAVYTPELFFFPDS